MGYKVYIWNSDSATSLMLHAIRVVQGFTLVDPQRAHFNRIALDESRVRVTLPNFAWEKFEEPGDYKKKFEYEFTSHAQGGLLLTETPTNGLQLTPHQIEQLGLQYMNHDGRHPIRIDPAPLSPMWGKNVTVQASEIIIPLGSGQVEHQIIWSLVTPDRVITALAWTTDKKQLADLHHILATIEPLDLKEDYPTLPLNAVERNFILELGDQFADNHQPLRALDLYRHVSRQLPHDSIAYSYEFYQLWHMKKYDELLTRSKKSSRSYETTTPSCRPITAWL